MNPRFRRMLMWTALYYGVRLLLENTCRFSEINMHIFIQIVVISITFIVVPLCQWVTYRQNWSNEAVCIQTAIEKQTKWLLRKKIAGV